MVELILWVSVAVVGAFYMLPAKVEVLQPCPVRRPGGSRR